MDFQEVLVTNMHFTVKPKALALDFEAKFNIF
jgi:hypothetical protein